ncbi:hypothetical protein QYF36_008384 [Acer negundo]|nr:hypothetical protein QYF36_008384 [Acer negundo]
MGRSMSFAQGVEPSITILIILEETSQESDKNDRDGVIGSDDEDGGNPTEFKTNTDHRLDNLDKQYPFTEEEVYCDSSSESDAFDHSHASGDDDLVSNTATQRGSSTVPRLWIILRSEQYSFQTINHESFTTDG